MRLFIDECLSPMLAHRLAAEGMDAVHPRDIGRLGEPDHLVLRRCLDEDRIIVTHNAGDFRALVGETELHPGLIILTESSRGQSWEMLCAALAHIERRSERRQAAFMVNRVVEASPDGIIDYPLPTNP